MVSLKRFLQGVQAIKDLHPQYKLGRSGDDGWCDCIGLIIGALKRAGYRWPGTHGSNYAVRNQVVSRRFINDASQLSVGDAVFKYHNPGEAGYSLPSGYASHPDQRDYYHVGVVTSIKPLGITHCSTNGVVTDTKLGKWRAAGWLKAVTTNDKEEDAPMGNQMEVFTGNSAGLNFRTKPKGGAKLHAASPLPNGAIVDVLNDEGGGWLKVQYGPNIGYCMGVYLRPVSDQPSAPSAGMTVSDTGSGIRISAGGVTIDMTYDQANTVVDYIIEKVGRG